MKITVLGTSLEMGDKGPKVKKAQELLQKAGSSIKVTGEFTIGMASAVKSFQKKNGLKPTGIINNATWEKLHAVKAPKKPAPKKPVKPAAKKVVRGKKA